MDSGEIQYMNTKTLIRLFVALIILATPALAQPPIIEIEAKTYDGKTVVLKSDGTWRYKDATGAGQPTTASGAKIEVEVAVVVRTGEVRPIARTPFYLLTKSLNTILSQPDLVAAFREGRQIGKTEDEFFYQRAALAGYVSRPRFTQLALSEIAKATSAKGTTDFSGKLEFTDVPDGQYFLTGWNPFGSVGVYWSFPVQVRDGKNLKVTLDQNNAL